MKKVFWFALGITVTVVAITKGKELLHKFTPAGVSEQVAEKGKDALDRVSSFWSDVTEAMDEREAELRAELNMTPKH